MVRMCKIHLCFNRWARLDIVLKKGKRAEELANRRVERASEPRTRVEVVNEAKESMPLGGFSLVIMMDGWMVRERGSQWGLKPAQRQANRVE